jgi:hypothetical protein
MPFAHVIRPQLAAGGPTTLRRATNTRCSEQVFVSDVYSPLTLAVRVRPFVRQLIPERPTTRAASSRPMSPGPIAGPNPRPAPPAVTRSPNTTPSLCAHP